MIKNKVSQLLLKYRHEYGNKHKKRTELFITNFNLIIKQYCPIVKSAKKY